jgi:hypothetical protein
MAVTREPSFVVVTARRFDHERVIDNPVFHSSSTRCE